MSLPVKKCWELVSYRREFGVFVLNMHCKATDVHLYSS